LAVSSCSRSGLGVEQSPDAREIDSGFDAFLEASPVYDAPSEDRADHDERMTADDGDVEDVTDVRVAPDAYDAGMPCPIGPCVEHIVAGALHACALMSDATVRCWGSNGYGQLGSGPLTDAGLGSAKAELHPRTVVGLPRVKQVAAGGDTFSCALTETSEVYCWGGFNECGQLGRGLEDAGSRPVRVVPEPVVRLADALEVGVGGEFGCAVTRHGVIECWGLNGAGQLGHPFMSPRMMPECVDVSDPSPGPALLPPGTFVHVAPGALHACALRDDGRIACWGYDESGEVGVLPKALPSGVSFLRVPPLLLPTPGNAVQLSAGSQYTCALTSTGVVECFGNNNAGLLGRPLITDMAPAAALLPSDRRAVQVATGYANTCAVLDDGTVWCWATDKAERWAPGPSKTPAAPAGGPSESKGSKGRRKKFASANFTYALS
jgi:alpha-tubulin suppressor-like RCC1 family protein